VEQGDLRPGQAAAPPQTRAEIIAAIEDTVRRRARHEVLDDVTKTLSDWNVADIVAGEYHGRFLIELIQNARDAFLERSPGATDGVVRVRLTREPALVVANQGAPLPTKVLLQSIGRFGLGTKTKGLSIGHKGIGFKSVLELSLTPEIYSCRSEEGFGLSVRFDPEEAARRVRAASPDWDELVRESPVGEDPAAAEHVPALLFPFVVDDADERLDGADRFEGGEFDSVVRLPHDARFDADLGLTRDAFVAKCRDAMRGVTDQIVLLLGAFRTVYLEDEEAGPPRTITRTEVGSTELPGGVVCRETVIEHDGIERCRWLVFDRSLPGVAGLEGTLVCALRIERSHDGVGAPCQPSIEGGDGGDCLHLFFPTTIPTCLPFLLHAYFRVDAGRKSFADADRARNEALLGELADLGVESVRHLLSREDLDLAGLPAQFAACDGDPKGIVAAARERMLAGLDELPWVPVLRPLSAAPARAEPRLLVIERDAGIAEELPSAIPPAHLDARLGLRYPHPAVTRPALDFLARRAGAARGGEAGLTSDMLIELLQPGEAGVWPADPGEIDAGFRSLLTVLTAMHGPKSARGKFLDDADTAAGLRFVPAVQAAAPFRRLREPVPGQQRGVSWILARTEAADGQAAPPEALAIDFLPDGLLPDMAAVLGAHFLGVREYRSDSVLDAITPAALAHPGAAEITPFMWRFLARDSTPTSTIDEAAALMSSFTPGSWHWSKPGVLESRREAMRRDEMLARLQLPAEDGSRAPADGLVFGAAWAEWCDRAAAQTGHGAFSERAASYRGLDALAPSRAEVLGGPERVLDFLGVPADGRGDDAMLLLHAFLARLGVWEVPPLAALNIRTSRTDEELDPWAGWPGRAEHTAWLAGKAGAFGRAHKRVHVGEDYALRWPLTSDPVHLEALGRGARLYSARLDQLAYCTGCNASGTHRGKAWDTDARDRGSYLAWQLETTRWMPVTFDRGRHAETVTPAQAWRDDASADQPHLGQGSARFLPRATRDVPAALMAVAGIGEVETGSPARVGGLLRWLHDQQPLLLGGEARPTSEAGRAYMSLHRRLYDRLLHLGGDHGLEATRLTGVLATKGSSLVFASSSDARHDRGSLALYRRLFDADVPFLAVKADRPAVATTLGVRAFEVHVDRLGNEEGEDVTPEVEEFVGLRLPMLLAALVYYPVAGSTLDIEGPLFRERAQRLAALSVRRVHDLALSVRVPDAPWERTMGRGRTGDIYVEGPTTVAPVVFHDFPGRDWVERFRSGFAPHLATIVENDAYVSVFRLLLEADDKDDALGILAGFGVTHEQVGEIAGAIGAADRAARDDEERWWRALLPLLGAEVATSPRDHAWRDELRRALEACRPDLDDPTVAALVVSGRTDGARRDIGAGGVLALLEAARVDLRDFHANLLAAEDRGLDVRGASRPLEAWRRAHQDEVVALLALAGDAEAASRPGAWAVPDEDDWHAVVAPSVYLAPVIADLERQTKLAVDAETLAGPEAAAELADLVGRTPSELRAWWAEQDPEVAAKVAERLARGWWQSIRSVVVAAALGRPSAPHEIRAEASRVDDVLARAASPAEIAELVQDLLPDAAGVADALAGLIAGHAGLSLPTVERVVGIAVDAGLDAALAEDARRVLTADAPAAADRVRRDVGVLVSAGIDPVEVHPDTPPPPPPKPHAGRIPVSLVKHQGGDTAAIGRAGERWALAAVLRALLTMSREQRLAAVDAIEGAIRERFSDEGLRRVERLAEEVRHAEDEDWEIEALSRLVHVSQISDAFGFDIVGYLPDDRGVHRVLLIEVKATGDRGFIVTRHEWDHVATNPDIRDVYAFMTVGRDRSGRPKALELVVNPADLHDRGLVRLDVRDWDARYRPPAARPAGS